MNPALTDFAVALRKALNAYRFYPPGHQKVIEFNEKVLSAVRTLGGVALDVTIAGLLVGETVVLEGESIQDAPTRPLFLEGLLRINISKEVPLAELSEVFRLWHAALVRQLPHGQSLTTALWELGLRKIDFEFSELAGLQDATDAELEREARRKTVIASLLQHLARKDGGRRAAPTDASAARGSLEATTGLDVAGPAGDFLLPAAITPAERDELARELRLTRPPMQTRLTVAAWEVFEAAVGAERALVATWFERAALESLEVPVPVLLDWVHRLKESARQNGAAERLVEWLAVFGQDAWVERFVALLNDPATAGGAEHLIASLPRSVVAELAPLLPRIIDAQTRARLVRHWCGRKVPLHRLAMAPLKPSDVSWLAVVVDEAPDGRAVLADVFAAGTPDLRVALLEQVPAVHFKAMKGALVAQLESPDARERLAVAKVVVSNQVSGTEDAVARGLSAVRGRPEAMAWMSLLASFETMPALDALATYFMAEKDLTLRIACARLMGQLGSPRLVGTLEEASKGFLTNRRLKDACAEAIRSIRRGAT